MERHASPLSLVLWATDVGAMTSFLTDVAGLTEVERHPGYASLRHGDADIAIHADESYRGHPWYEALAMEGAARGIGTEIRLRVDDVEACYRAALAAGAVAITGPYEDAGLLQAQVMGPDGYLFALWQPCAPSAPGELPGGPAAIDK